MLEDEQKSRTAATSSRRIDRRTREPISYLSVSLERELGKGIYLCLAMDCICL